MSPSALLCATILLASNTGVAKLDKTRVSRACSAAETMVREGNRYGVDPYVIAALAYKESRWNPTKKGGSGECGVTQVLPRYAYGNTCLELQVPNTSVAVTAKKLSPAHACGRRGIARCKWEVKVKVSKRCNPLLRALACYNAGTAGLRNSPTPKGIRGRKYSKSVYRLYKKLRRLANQ
jgi:hypothetical protein